MTTPVRSIEHVRWGFADMWFAPEGTAEPLSTTSLAEPGIGWTGVPYTAEGAAFTVGKETEVARVEEELLDVGEDITGVSIQLVLAIAEDTIANRALAYGNADVVATAAGASQIGKKKLSFGTQLKRVALVLMATNGYGFKDRIYLPSVIATGDVETAYRRSPSDKRTLPTTFKVIGALDDISIIGQDAAPTS